MAYNPGISYRGDQYAFQGITGAASALAAGIDESRKKREQMEKEQALNDPIMKHAVETGQLSDEDYNAYVAAPHNKKQSMANGLMANIASDFARQKFAADQAQQQQEMAQRLQIAQMSAGGRGGGPAFAPPPEQVARLLAKGYEVVPTSRGGSQVVNMNTAAGAALPEAGSPVYDDGGNPIGVWDAKGKIARNPAPPAPRAPSDIDKILTAATAPDSAAPAPAAGGGMSRVKDFLKNGPWGAAAPSGPAQISSKEEFDQLPPGAVFVAPDGSTRRKP